MIKNIKHPKTTIVIIALIVAAGIFAGFHFMGNNNSQSNPSKKTGSINLKPATKEDKERADATKESNIEKEKSDANETTPATSGKKSVSPVITYADEYNNQVEVGARVSGVIEDGGTCTATFTLGSETHTKQVTGVTDVSSVSCPVMILPVSLFSQKGAWNVTVSYESATSTGTSPTKQVVIQ